jgi:dTDP-4-amino-4,6-dideoxygalactose transaminase
LKFTEDNVDVGRDSIRLDEPATSDARQNVIPAAVDWQLTVMPWRRQLPVSSPIRISDVISAFVGSLRTPSDVLDACESQIAARFNSTGVLLTDSGTSALVLALRSALSPGGCVGLPAYGCVDFVAAAVFAGARVRFYDVDPASLSPDVSSVREMFRLGVEAVVVGHLFGYAADVPTVKQLAASEGIPVIEDAAQGAGGTLNGERLGSLAELSVLSFGRGKGLCAGGGGALLSRGARWSDSLQAMRVESASRGLSGLTATAAQWALGRPWLYPLPSMLPWLHLGEMVYHPAHEPQALSVGSQLLLDSALSLEPEDLVARRARAQRLDELVREAKHIVSLTAIPGANPGYLRYPVRSIGATRAGEPSYGIVRPYPVALRDHPAVAQVLAESPATPGAAELSRTLFTLPTHRFVTEGDLNSVRSWLGRDV